MTEQHNKISGLDVLRAFAILFVFIYHYIVFFEHPLWLENIGKFGWTGVDLFFVLSGYLIASQLFDNIRNSNKINLRVFFIKRIFRIFPAYFFILTIYFLFPFVREKESLAPLWKYLTFTLNLNLNSSLNGTFSHAWSLCVEEQFYLIFPLILYLIFKLNLFNKSWLLICFLFIAGFLIRHFWWVRINELFGGSGSFKLYWIMRLYFPTYCRLDGLLAGISIAALINYKPNFRLFLNKNGYFFLGLGLLVLFAAYILCTDETSYNASVFGFPLVSIGYGFIVLSALSVQTFLHKSNYFITSKIATYSYSIYLSHKIIIHLVQRYFANYHIETDSTWVLLASFFCSVFVAFLIYNFIEKPFLKIRVHIINKINLAR